jgi:hypothetical protein
LLQNSCVNPNCFYKTIAYGGEPDTPDVSTIGAFLREKKEYTTRCFDLISYQLVTQIRAEKEAGIEMIGSGGLFVKPRLDEAFHYDEDWHLVDPTWSVHDAELINHLSKYSNYCIPAPNALSPENKDESFYSLCQQYRAFMREMRDAGVHGHVLIATHIDEIFCEELIGRRISVFLTRDSRKEDMECLLEYQHTITLHDSSMLESLLDQYSITTVSLIDPTNNDLQTAVDLMDREKIWIGGYNGGEEQERNRSELMYWDEVVKRAKGLFPSHR